ncbi:TPA: hypothetical protein ACGHFV_003402 [Salmonella enterica subsp. enterica serovar Johannesburg]|nr:hypothetical protein [Salmonella enterica subsp. enterica serovar Johannesburg]HEC8634201.1 hypothetical protein [Salmonella enterica subsp. enterica serovar Johannesburg]HEC8725016.1 hypothetical protein [Salmonella enterica subsp. enterica serovar Johannesburg]HED0316075.1 hypothetical protein [Salmonella enterica subsp. enterica serovar Johannesburg]
MGMFDEVSFAYRMPDGYDGEYFQTTDLDCDGSSYEIDEEGRLLKNGEDLHFNGEFEMSYDEYFSGRSGDFRMVFRDGRLVYIIPARTHERYLFDTGVR